MELNQLWKQGLCNSASAKERVLEIIGEDSDLHIKIKSFGGVNGFEIDIEVD